MILFLSNPAGTQSYFIIGLAEAKVTLMTSAGFFRHRKASFERYRDHYATVSAGK